MHSFLRNKKKDRFYAQRITCNLCFIRKAPNLLLVKSVASFFFLSLAKHVYCWLENRKICRKSEWKPHLLYMPDSIYWSSDHSLRVQQYFIHIASKAHSILKNRHTFCLQCIQQALESSNLCPIDRAVISHELQPAIKIISNMVNELLVHCTQEGCDFTCQRQLIESHIKNDCQYTMTCCELEECQELFLKRDLGSHAEKCQFRTSECFMCKKKLKVFELQVENTYTDKRNQ